MYSLTISSIKPHLKVTYAVVMIVVQLVKLLFVKYYQWPSNVESMDELSHLSIPILLGLGYLNEFI
jgi:hypothetical protein